MWNNKTFGQPRHPFVRKNCCANGGGKVRYNCTHFWYSEFFWKRKRKLLQTSKAPFNKHFELNGMRQFWPFLACFFSCLSFVLFFYFVMVKAEALLMLNSVTQSAESIRFWWGGMGARGQYCGIVGFRLNVINNWVTVTIVFES